MGRILIHQNHCFGDDCIMTFTGDLFKITLPNNEFVFKVSKIDYGPLKYSSERSMVILAVLFFNHIYFVVRKINAFNFDKSEFYHTILTFSTSEKESY